MASGWDDEGRGFPAGSAGAFATVTRTLPSRTSRLRGKLRAHSGARHWRHRGHRRRADPLARPGRTRGTRSTPGLGGRAAAATAGLILPRLDMARPRSGGAFRRKQNTPTSSPHCSPEFHCAAGSRRALGRNRTCLPATCCRVRLGSSTLLAPTIIGISGRSRRTPVRNAGQGMSAFGPLSRPPPPVVRFPRVAVLS